MISRAKEYYYCGGVKWSAPEISPDLAHAEHILAFRQGLGNSYSCTEDFVYIKGSYLLY
jgi:hypothetical protein